MIFLGLGSNQGEKVVHIFQALERLEEKGVQVLRLSSLYVTPPWGIIEQEEFVNAVAEVSFQGSATTLLHLIGETEQELGRVRTQKWGPRIIDIDILEFHREHWQSEILTLPHPYYTERTFVLAPLKELEPDWIPTGDHRTVSEILSALPHQDWQILNPI